MIRLFFGAVENRCPVLRHYKVYTYKRDLNHVVLSCVNFCVDDDRHECQRSNVSANDNMQIYLVSN